MGNKFNSGPEIQVPRYIPNVVKFLIHYGPDNAFMFQIEREKKRKHFCKIQA